MATLKFYLKDANKKNLHPIMLCYQDKGEKFRFSTRLHTNKSKWQGNKVKAISLEDFETNERLGLLEKIFHDIEKESISSKVRYSVKEVESRFKEKMMEMEEVTLLKSSVEYRSEFFRYYDQFIEQSKATKAKKTISSYITCKNGLMEFESFSNYTITFSSINSRFYEQFFSYLIVTRKFLNNTIGNRVKNLKVFLNYAMRNGLTDIIYNFKDFKTLTEDVDIITLTEQELFKIYQCENLSKSQDVARDYLCFECFTGLRFSDIGRLKHENIKDGFMVLKTKKTKDNLFVPINVFAKEIINKYKGKFTDSLLPPPYANQVINRLIKEVAEIAKIDDIIMVEKFSGSNRLTITNPKYSFISTHTGRRTFITLSHEKGMQVEMIMKITGIKKWDTLKKYLKVSEKSKLIKMNEFWNHNVMKESVKTQSI